jgi:hypothetical protein
MTAVMDEIVVRSAVESTCTHIYIFYQVNSYLRDLLGKRFHARLRDPICISVANNESVAP